MEEVTKFQDYLGPKGYRIIVVDATRGGVIFKGDKYEGEPKTIALVKSVYVDDNNVEKAHYDGLYSIPGLMNRSYFCKKCCKGYNYEDSAHHSCQAKNCPACKRNKTKQDGCEDFSLWAKPDRSCRDCRREFYGESCFRAHLIQEEDVDKELEKMKNKLEQQLNEKLPALPVHMKSTCSEFKRCGKCLVTFKVNKEFPHKCLHAQCKHCLEYVNIYEHRCYITSEEEKRFKRTLQDLRKKKKKKEILLGLVLEDLYDSQTQAIIDDLVAKRKKKLKELEQINNGVPMSEIKLTDLQEKVIDELLDEGMTPDDITLEMVSERMPQRTELLKGPKKIFADNLVFADIECIIDSNKTFIPVLICYARGYSKTIYHH